MEYLEEIELSSAVGTVELLGTILIETDAAVLFNDGDNETWIPRSQILHEEDVVGGLVSIIIPEWLAEKKGLI